MDNINNNDCDNNNEILFWKVIHNKYLFGEIFNHIISSESEWVNNKNKAIGPIFRDKRIKFKYIYDSGWMIENKQFQLLKYKLSINDEYVEVNEIHLNSFLKINQQQQQTLINNELYMELLKLLFKRKNQILDSNLLISTALQYCELQVINLLFECCLQRYISDGTIATFESFIINALNNNNKSEFNNYMECISKNNNHRNSIINYIFNNIKMSGFGNKTITNQSEGVKLMSNNKVNGITQPQQLQSENIKIISTVILLIEDIEIINWLLEIYTLEIKEVNESDETSPFDTLLINLVFGDENTKNTHSMDKIGILMVFFKVFNKFQQQQKQQLLQLYQIINFKTVYQHSTEELKIKELFKQYIIFTKSNVLFNFYLLKYNETITELISIYTFYQDALNYSKNFLKVGTLKYLNIDHNSTFSSLDHDLLFRDHRQLIKSTNLDEKIEFLKMYLLKVNGKQVKYNEKVETFTLTIIYDILFSIKDPLVYQDLILNYIPENHKKYFPLTWNPIMNFTNLGEISIIDCKSTIDWLKEWLFNRLDVIVSLKYDPNKIKFDSFLDNCLKFQNIQLVEYAIKQLSFLKLPPSYFYKSIFCNSIIDGNFKDIQQFYSLGINFTGEFNLNFSNYFNSCLIRKRKLKEINPINYQEHNQTFNYLIKNDMVPIINLIEIISDNGYYDEINENSAYQDYRNVNPFKFNLSKIKLNLNLHQQTLYCQLIYYGCSYKFHRLVFENLKFTNLVTIIDRWTSIPRKELDEQNITLLIDQINKCKSLIGNMKTITTTTTDANVIENQIPNLDIYYQFVNITFHHIIAYSVIDGNFSKRLDQIYQILIDNQIVLNDQVLFDLKLNYINCKLPFFYLYTKKIIYNKIKAIKPIPFETIQNSSVDQLIILLIDRPYVELLNGGTIILEYHKMVINANLELFILIKRWDLFLKEWEILTTKCNLKQLPSLDLIKPCCINLELNSIDNILQVINSSEHSNSTSKLQILQFCNTSLKLGRFDISKLSLSFLSKHFNGQYPKLFQQVSNYNDTDYLQHRINLINQIENIIKNI